MSDPGLYSVMYILVEGALLAQHGSASLTRTTGSSEVKSVALGYCGETPGAPMGELSIKSAVPVAGLEFDAGKVMIAMKPVEIGLLSHGKQATFKGFIIKDAVSHSVGSEESYDFDARGQMPVFK